MSVNQRDTAHICVHITLHNCHTQCNTGMEQFLQCSLLSSRQCSLLTGYLLKEREGVECFHDNSIIVFKMVYIHLGPFWRTVIHVLYILYILLQYAATADAVAAYSSGMPVVIHGMVVDLWTLVVIIGIRVTDV